MKRQRDKMVFIDPTHHMMAKSIASLKGMSMKRYFGSCVEQDVQQLPQEMLKRMMQRGGK